jgi:hypothetical protein
MTVTNAAANASERTGIAGYQWLALWSAFLGWLFDSMDLNLFTLVLFPSVGNLIKSSNPAAIAEVGGYIMGIKLFCWGIGGIIFGVVADRIGRARTMVITVLMYATFTGLSGLAQSWQQLAILQALAGFGIGGEWSAGAALLAESWPEKHRARAMQVMQMAFAFGFFVAALDNLILGPISWRWVLAAGALPAVVALGIRWFVQEPDRWLRVRQDRAVAQMSMTATFSRIFAPDLRRRTIVGVRSHDDSKLGRNYAVAELGPAACARRGWHAAGGRSNHQLRLHAHDDWRRGRILVIDFSDRCRWPPTILFPLLPRQPDVNVVSVHLYQRRAHVDVVHAGLWLLHHWWFWDLCRIFAGAIPNARAGKWSRLLLERGAVSDRGRSVHRRLLGRRVRIDPGGSRVDFRFLWRRTGGNLVRP